MLRLQPHFHLRPSEHYDPPNEEATEHIPDGMALWCANHQQDICEQKKWA